MKCVHGVTMRRQCDACIDVNRQANREALATLKASHTSPVDRCPVCDRTADNCNRFRLFPWAGRLDGTDDSVGDARYECYRHEVDWRARAIAAEPGASRWARVEPLIERLREVADADTSDPIHVVDTVTDLPAATKEPTP